MPSLKRNNTIPQHADESLQYLARLVDEARDVIFSTDTSFKITWWNKAAANFYGYSTQQVKGKSLPDIVRPGLNAEGFKKIDESMLLHGSWQGEVSHMTADGSKHIIAETISAIYDTDGKPSGYIFIGRDITMQHEVEEKNKYLAAVLQKINDAVFSTDTSRTIQVWNKGAELMFGYSAEEAVGKTSVALLLPDADESQLQSARNAVLQNGHWHGEITYRHKNGGTIPVDMSVSLYKDIDDWVHFIYVCRDITHKKMEANQLLNRTKQLEEANRLIEAIAHSVSRDMRKILHACRLSAGTLANDKAIKESANAPALINKLQNHIAELFDLSDNLLSFSGIAHSEIDFHLVDMDAVVDKCIDQLMTIEERSFFHIIKSTLPACMGDAGMLQQVWYSLLSAAVRDACHLARPYIEIGSTTDAHSVIYYVIPYGIHSDKAVNSSFQQLYNRLSTESSKKDSERELNFVKRVVLRHGGSIGVKSVAGKEQMFFFSLPKRID